MANTSLSDHVMVFSGALSPEHCRTLIERFESASDPETCQVAAGYSFSQINVTQKWPDQNKILVPVFLSYFNQYQLALNARFWPLRFSFEQLRMKRYLANGRDSFPVHVDVMGQVASRRFMTAFIYLNATAGGETVFPNLNISIAPEPGKLLAFPPIWLFPHAGLPPQSDPKYILHTYLCYPTEPRP
jgi:2-oxoglutarate-Fe(II)-dependent oxygenase superfamily protein